MNPFRFVLAVVFAAVLTAHPRAHADFPDKPIRFILGFAAGGPTDLSVRALAAAAARRLGQPLVVQNLTGAGGTLAMAEIASAPADGYTISMITTTYKGVTVHAQKLNFDKAQLQTLLGYAEFRHVLFVRPDSPYTTIEEMLKFGREHPGELTFGHVGPGTSLQLQGLQFFRSAGVQVTDVPYRGSSAFTTAVLGGHVDAAFGAVSAVKALVQAGKIRLLATLTTERLPEFPNVPTARELRIEGPDVYNPVIGVTIRAGTAPDRVKLLHDALKASIADPGFTGPMNEIGLKTGYHAPQEFDGVVARIETLAVPLLKELGLFAR